VKHENNPGISSIAFSFGYFYKEFLKLDGNIRKAPVLNNPLLCRNANGTKCLDTEFFSRNILPITEREISQCKVEDFIINGRLKALDEINQNLPVQISLVTYMRMGEASRFWDKIVKKNTSIETEGTGISLATFQIRHKKGSKLFRKILGAGRIEKKEKILKNSLKNFLRVSGLGNNIQNPNGTGTDFFSWWSKGYANNRLKEFLFKFSHNLLGVNSRVAHFNANVNASCTFCTLENRIPAPEETFTHLFFECPTTDNIHRSTGDRWLGGLVIGDEPTRKRLWLLGEYTTGAGENKTNEFLKNIIGVSQWYIWECKLKKKQVSWSGCSVFVIENLGNMLRVSSRLRDSMFSINLDVCRHWRRAAQ
jgi:hypothetical protein